MAIKISINKKAEASTPDSPGFVFKIGERPPTPHASINLQARRTLAGNVLVLDHPLIDILILKDKNKIVTFIKDNFSDETYAAQSRLFDYLRKKGVIEYDSIQGGNIYGSLEAKYPKVDDRSALEAVLFTIGKFVNQEKADELEATTYQQDVEDMYVEPSDEDSTELGEVPPPDPHDSGPKGPPPTRYSAVKSGLPYRTPHG